MIGVDATGKTALGNGAGGGVVITDSSGNTIGGTMAGAAKSFRQLKGIGSSACPMAATANQVLGKSIGTAPAER